MVRNGLSYLGLGESLVLGEYKCFSKCMIKKGFTRKDAKKVINGEYSKFERTLENQQFWNLLHSLPPTSLGSLDKLESLSSLLT